MIEKITYTKFTSLNQIKSNQINATPGHYRIKLHIPVFFDYLNRKKNSFFKNDDDDGGDDGDKNCKRRRKKNFRGHS